MDQTILLINEWLTKSYVRAVVILIASWLIAIVVRYGVIRFLMRMTKKTKNEFDDNVIDILKTPIFLMVFLAGFSYSARAFGFGPDVNFVIFGILKTLAVMIWGRAVMRIASLFLQALSNLTDKVKFIQPATLPLFEIFTKVLIVAAIAYFAMISWNIDVTGWLASAGVVGIAVGFAAKDTLANLFAGIFILTDAPYKVGDMVNLGSGQRGVVTDIGIRSTRILTRDDVEITVPNASIANSKIVNETSGPHEKIRIRISVSVAYGSDVDQVKQIMMDCTKEVEYLSRYPTPSVRFIQFGDSGLLFELRAWVQKPKFKGRVVDALNTRVYRALNESGIEIPYPKRDLIIKTEQAEKSEKEPEKKTDTETETV